ncbi:MAG: glycosyltransferase involved in cell wall biosynthesis [Flavobacteriales bacterium]|jgi:glycosyltransferase involved in cell wall biosynthesis
MEYGINKKLNILIISSGMPTDNSPKQVIDVSKSLGIDHNVDLLLKYPMISDVSTISVYNGFDLFFITKFSFIIRGFNFLKRRIKKAINVLIGVKNRIEQPQYHFFGIDDKNPPVSSKKILNQIRKEYDFVIIFFWQGMITSKTLNEIYQKTKKPILLMAADMFPMTGGCSYFWDCDRLEKSCGKCPGLNSNDENDITRKNFLYKKTQLENINCVFLGNSWMNGYAQKTGLFKNIDTIYPIIDENIFKPRDKEFLRKEKKYSDKIILFFGAVTASEVRKGSKYLVESLQLLAKNRPDLAAKVLLLVAGNESDISGLDEYEVIKTGHLSFEKLAECYAMADVFLSPSVQDAGPMMLNQALLCGTPSVAFRMGTACDILNSETGYIANYRDSEDFCRGIISLIDKSKEELEVMSKECRRQSLAKYSYDAYRENIIRIYNSVK